MDTTANESPAAPARLGPGIYTDLDKATYLSDPCERPSLSHSIACELLRAPSFAQHVHPRLGAQGQDPTAAMIRGSVLDSLLMGGDASFSVIPEMALNSEGEMVETRGERKLKSVKEWAEKEEAAGKTVLSAKALHENIAKAAGIKENLFRRWGLELNGQTQVSMIWEDSGALCRGRIDMLWMDVSKLRFPWLRGLEALILDLKVVSDASPQQAPTHFERYGWDVQGAAYVSGFEKLHPGLAGRVGVAFALCEPEPPYETLVVPPSAQMRVLGAWKWRKALASWVTCLEEGKWPGYQLPRFGVEPRPWSLFEMENEGVPPGGSTPAF